MTIEISDTVLLLPIGNMIGDVVAFKSTDVAVGDKVVLFPCEVTEGFEYIVACKPMNKDPACQYVFVSKVVVVPVGGNKDYIVALAMPGEEELELKFTELWEEVCGGLPLKYTELWNERCLAHSLEHTEEWES